MMWLAILAIIFALCGIAWIIIAHERERMCAVHGNTRHFIKMAWPGGAAVVVAAIIFIWSATT